MYWIYPVYVVLLALVVFLSIKLANLVDLLDKKTSISGAFIGGVLLAAVTSLPELFTSISAVAIVNDPTLVIGDILGSDIFNIMILGVYTIIFFKTFKKSEIAKWHMVSIAVLALMYGLTTYALFAPANFQPMLGSINLISIINLACYIVLILKQPKEAESDEKEEVTSKLTVKQIVILFVLCAVVLIGASIAITYVTDLITNEISWLDGTIGGAILLGVATSLPEVISTFHLFKIRNFDAGYGNMIGSCTFNFLVLSIADIISWEQMNPIVADRGIFISNVDSQQLVLFGLIAIVSLTGLLGIKMFTKWYESKKWSFWLALLLSCICFASYILVFVL